MKAFNVTGPNGAPVLGAPVTRDRSNYAEDYNQFSDRGDRPQRYPGSGGRSYPKKDYNVNSTAE